MKTRLKDKISRWLSVAASIGLAASACADNAAVTVTVDGTSVTASNASAANYDNYTWHKSNYSALKLNIPACSDLAADTYLRLTSLSIGAQNNGSGNYNNQVKYVAVTGVDGFAYKSEIINTTSGGFSSTAATPETSDKQTFLFANPWCFVQVGMDYTVELLDADGNAVAGLSSRCVEYTESVLTVNNGNQWTPLAEVTAEIVTPTTPDAVSEEGDYAIALDGLATYPSISVAGNLNVIGSGTIIVTGDFTLGGTLTVDSGVNFAFTTTTGTVKFPVGTTFAGLNIADISKLYVTGTVTTDGTVFAWASGSIPKPTNNYIASDTHATQTRVSRVETNTGYAYVGGWQLYWAGASGANWDLRTNWKYADGTTADGYPNNNAVPGDHVYITYATTISTTREVAPRTITVNADTIFTGGNTIPYRFYTMDGSGKVTMNGTKFNVLSSAFTIENDLCILGENVISCGSAVCVLNGDLSGSGKLTVNNNNWGGLSLRGDNSDFYGEFVNTDAGTRNNSNFGGATPEYASSSNAVWTLRAQSQNGVNTKTFFQNSNTYYFGALNGYVQTGDSGTPTVEIGARADVSSEVTLSGRGTASNGKQYYFNVVKVGGNTLTVKSDSVNLGNVTIKGGVLEMPLVPTYGSYLKFDGEGGTLRQTAADLDFSSRITGSSASICYDTADYSTTWATALAASNTGGLTKKGAGTLTLSQTPLYTGPTVVENGTLVLPAGTVLDSLSIGENGKVQLDLSSVTSESDDGIIFSADIASGTVLTESNFEVLNDKVSSTYHVNAAGTSIMVYKGSPRTLTWTGASADDNLWSNPANWSIGGEAATIAPTAIDSVVFETATPGVVLESDVIVQNLTATYGLTLATTYAINVADTTTITGTANFTDTSATSAIITAHPEYTQKLVVANDLALTGLSGGATLESSADQTVTIASDTTSTFYGTLAGSMGLVKAGEGTLELQGRNTFSGDVSVQAGTLKLSAYDYASLVRFDFDAQDTSRWTIDATDNTVTQMKTKAGGYGSSSTQDSRTVFNSYGETKAVYSSSATYFGGKPHIELESGASYSYANSRNDYSSAQGWLIAYVANSAGNMLTEGSGTGYLQVDASGAWTLRSHTDYHNDLLYVDGEYGRASTLQTASTIMTFTSLPYNSNRYDILGTTFNGAVGQMIGFGVLPSLEVYNAVNAYVMQKWGCSDAVNHQMLPATADVSVSAGATLDLGGMTVTVASLDLAGTLANGTLIVTGNNLTIANATAAITAIIMVSGYDSSMTAPTGYRFVDNGDGTATLVPVSRWTDGTGDHAWGTAGNWDKNSVPGENDEVVFPSENAPEGGWTVYVGRSEQTCRSITLNADVTLSFDANQSNWSGINVKEGVGGSGKLILWRSGVNNVGSSAATISCPIVVKSHSDDSFLQKVGFNVTGPVEVNSLFVVYDATTFSGTVTLKDGAVIQSGASHYNSGAEAQVTFSGAIVIPDGASVSFDRSSQTITGSVTMGAGSTFTLSGATTATAATFTLGDGAKLVVPSGSSVTAENIQGAAVVSYTSGTDTVYVNNTAATWVGSTSGSWNTESNWSTGVVPGRSTAVVFPAGAATSVTTGTWGNGNAFCLNLTVKRDVTFDGGYVTSEGLVSGAGTLTLSNWVWFNTWKGSTMTIDVGKLVLVNCDFTGNVESGYDIEVACETEITGTIYLHEPVLFSARMNVPTGVSATINASDNGSLTIAGTVTLEGADSTLTVPANADVSGATFVCGVAGYTVELDGTTYKAQAPVVTPGTPVSVDSKEAAAAYTVTLTEAQETQGLEASYYTTKVEYDETTQKYVVTAELNEAEVAPAVKAGVAVSGTTVTLPVTNLKKGLCYRVVSGNSPDAKTPLGDWSNYYDGVNAPSLTATLPDSGVLYYAIEASDAK